MVWLVDLQLPMQSVPITTKVVNYNPVHDEVHSIQHQVIKFVSDVPQVGGFHWILRCHPSTNNIAKILLKVTINTIIITLTRNNVKYES